jgi:hypothetical protein
MNLLVGVLLVVVTQMCMRVFMFSGTALPSEIGAFPMTNDFRGTQRNARPAGISELIRQQYRQQVIRL